MMHKDTPPSSPHFDPPNMDDEDAILDEEDVEIFEIEENDLDDFEDAEMEESVPITDDAKFVFTKHTKSVFCGSLSKDSKLAVTGGEDDKAYVWDTTKGDVILECTHNESVIFADFNHNDTLLATGDMNGVVQVWDLKDNKLIWDNQISEITWMQWHMGANVLFATSVEGEIYMWKIPDGDCKSLQSLQQRVETALLFPDGKRLAVGYESGTMRIIDLKTGSVLNTVSPDAGHTDVITSMDCHPNNNLIISASVDGTTILTTSQTGKVVSILQNLKQHNDAGSSNEDEMESDDNLNWVETVKFHSDPQRSIAATGTRDGEIFVWDTTKQVMRNRIILTSGITKLLWKEGTSLIFSIGLNGLISCCDGWTGEERKTYSGHAADILDLCISRDGKRILTSSDDCTARIFEIEL